MSAPRENREDARPWTETACSLADHSAAWAATPMTDAHLERLAECALGPTRLNPDGVADRLFHLEHVAGYDVPQLVREIVRLHASLEAR
jgi:hypothetical protein